MQPFEALFEQPLERNGRHPTTRRIDAARHLFDHDRKVVTEHGDAGDSHLGHEQIERRDDERFFMDGHDHHITVHARAMQRRVKRRGNTGGIHGGVRAVTPGEIANGRYRVDVRRIEDRLRAKISANLPSGLLLWNSPR